MMNQLSSPGYVCMSMLVLASTLSLASSRLIRQLSKDGHVWIPQTRDVNETLDELYSLDLLPEAASNSEFAFSTFASGTQNYRCSEKGEWVFSEPVADLFDPNTGHHVGIHFFVDDDGFGGRATWASLPGLQDSSSVTVQLLRSEPSPTSAADNGVNIAWLLTQSTSTNGSSFTAAYDFMFAAVRHVVRVNTVNGVAPDTSECIGRAGYIAKQPYTAEYYFFKHADSDMH